MQQQQGLLALQEELQQYSKLEAQLQASQSRIQQLLECFPDMSLPQGIQVPSKLLSQLSSATSFITPSGLSQPFPLRQSRGKSLSSQPTESSSLHEVEDWCSSIGESEETPESRRPSSKWEETLPTSSSYSMDVNLLDSNGTQATLEMSSPLKAETTTTSSKGFPTRCEGSTMPTVINTTPILVGIPKTEYAFTAVDATKPTSTVTSPSASNFSSPTSPFTLPFPPSPPAPPLQPLLTSPKHPVVTHSPPWVLRKLTTRMSDPTVITLTSPKSTRTTTILEERESYPRMETVGMKSSSELTCSACVPTELPPLVLQQPIAPSSCHPLRKFKFKKPPPPLPPPPNPY